MMLVYNSDTLYIVYIERKDLIYVSIQGDLPYRDIEMAADSLKKLADEIYAKRILAETSHLKLIKYEAIEYIFNHVFPVFREIGIKKAVVLKPISPLGQKSLQTLLTGVQVAQVKEFDNLVDSEEWLYHP